MIAGRLVFTLVAAWLPLAGTAPAAVRPADGDWQASNTFGPWAEVVSFTVEGNGTRITNTNGLVGNPTSCGRAGQWAEPPAVPISGGSFATHVNGAAEVNPDQIDVRGTVTSRSTATVTFTISCLRSSGRIVQTRSIHRDDRRAAGALRVGADRRRRAGARSLGRGPRASEALPPPGRDPDPAARDRLRRGRAGDGHAAAGARPRARRSSPPAM